MMTIYLACRLPGRSSHLPAKWTAGRRNSLCIRLRCCFG